MPRLSRPARVPASSTLAEAWVVELPDHVEVASISPDGTRVAAAAVSGPVWILDGASGSVLARSAGHRHGTTALAWSPDGAVVVTGGQDGRVRVWDGRSGAELAAYPAGDDWVSAVTWSTDGGHLATAAGRALTVRDRGGEAVATYRHQSSSISGIAWKPGAPVLAISGYGGVTLLRPGSGREPRSFTWKGSVLTLAWSPDARFIATGDQDSTVHFWYAQTGRDLQMWGYETKVRELAWDPSSRYLATGGGVAAVVWDCSGRGPEGTRPRTLGAGESYVSALAWQGNGPLLASGSHDGVLALWAPARSSKPIVALPLTTPVSSLHWSPDDTWLVCGTGSGSLGRFDAR